MATSLFCILLIILVATCLVNSSWVHADRIVHVAGKGVGDGWLAINASVSGEIRFASNGDAYVADSNNHRIRKISNGIITTIAGTGVAGYSGDGGLATNAQLSIPFGIALGSNGDIYFPDSNNYRIRKISNGIITTIAGTGVRGYSGDGGLATQAQLSIPSGIALDSNGDIYIADPNNQRIRKIFSNGTITTIAGTGVSGDGGDGGLATNTKLSFPRGIELSSNDDIYIADTSNHKIRKISNGIITTIAGIGVAGYGGDGGLATNAQLNNPSGIAMSSNGDIYICDVLNNRIRKISNGTITTIAGAGGYSGDSGDGVLATNAKLTPFGIALRSNEVFITEQSSIRLVGTNNIITTFAGTKFIGDNLLAIVSGLDDPNSLAMSSNGDIYIADSNNHRIRKISSGIITTIAGTGVAGYGGDGGLATIAQLNNPYGIVLGSNDDLYFTDLNNNRIRKIFSNGTIVTIAGTASGGIGGGGVGGIGGIGGIGGGIGGLGGNSGYSGDGGLATNAQLNNPSGMAMSSNGDIYFADTKNHRIRKIFSNGTIVTIAGTGSLGYSGDGGLATNAQLNSPRGIALSLNGDIYICDVFNSRIRKIFSNGTIVTIAGTGSLRYGGDGGLATNAQLNSPKGIALSSNGDIYIADTNNYRIRKIFSNGTIVTAVGSDAAGYNNDENPLTALLRAPSGLLKATDGNLYFSDTTNNVVKMLTEVNMNPSYCYGIIFSDPTVCNGKGTCNGLDMCNCTDGWSGNNCSVHSCNEIPQYSEHVCSGHGSCDDVNLCNCNSTYWGGNLCEIPKCYGILANESNVCNGHGLCIGADVCSCNATYWGGNNCQTPKCNGTLATETANVCNGHGTCDDADVCNCNSTYWGGDFCRYSKCYGVLSTESLVCSGSDHGSCVDADLCSCNSTFWGGKNCQTPKCNGTLATDSNVCNSQGVCSGADFCACNSTFGGKYCQTPKCHGTLASDSSVCSGHGTCYLNKCECQKGYEGSLCDLYRCNGQLVNISTICEDQRICSPLLNCSGNGECDILGKCHCYSNSSKGYWKNETCNQCQENYFGRDCLTSLSGSVRFLDDFSGIYFTLYGSLKADQNITCSSIIPPFESYLYGSNPKCNWVFPSQFYIIFGQDFKLTPNMLIHLNMLVFDNMINSGMLISTNVLLPLSSSIPTAQIIQPRSEYGSCEEITIDGSASFSPDHKPLIFIWTISKPFNINTNSSYITLPMSAPSGDYSISLRVISSFTGLESQIYQISFKKQQIPYPAVSITGGNYVSKIVTQVPVVIGTIISLPECVSNTSNSLAYKWEKLVGPELSMISNTKDLIITEFKEKTEQFYTFKLTVYSLENVDMVVNSLVYLNTTLEPFNTILYISELTTEHAINGAEFSTSLDLSSETFKWSCQETISLSPCENSINSALATSTLSKSTLITIPKTNQNISIILQVRNIISKIDVIFPMSSTLVAPLINLLMVSPSDRTVLRSSEVLNLQFSISLNGIEEGIDSMLERVWTLNGQSIPTSFVGSMKTSLSNSNYILLDISKLEPSSEYTLQLQATNLQCGLTSSYSFKFSVAKPVPICNPSSSLLSVYALETKITLSLPNCKVDSTLESKFYFLDSQSGARIYLNSGLQTTTLLPLSGVGTLTIISVISDKITGEFSEGSIKITTLLPIAFSLKELKVKQKNWAAQIAILLPGDPQTNVLNSGTVAGVVQKMSAKLSGARRKLTSCQNGVLNSKTQECTCNEGYAKLDCSITKEEWIERNEIMDSLANLFFTSYYSRNKYEKLSESALISQIFAMRNILQVFDELSSGSIDSMLTILGELSVDSLNNKNLATPVGLEALFVEIINDLYRYRHLILKDSLNSIKMNYLMNITLDMGNFLIRNKFIGTDLLDINTDLIRITSNRLYPRDLSQYLLAQSNTTSIKLPNGMMKYVESYSKRKPLTLRLSTTNQYNGSTSGDMKVLSKLVTFEVLEFSLSNISERITYKMDISSISTRDSSEIVCGMLVDGNWDLSKCSIYNNSDCLCSQQGSVSLISLSHKEQSTTPVHKEQSTIPVTSNTNLRLELLALLSLLALVILVCVVISLIIICILRKKKVKKNPPSNNTDKEMVSV